MSKPKNSPQLGRQDFFEIVAKDFPNTPLKGSELLHVEMAIFREFLEEKIEDGQIWDAEKGFKLIERLFESADAELSNAIEISFLKDFAFGSQTEKQKAFIKERAPKRIREILKSHTNAWS